MLGNIQTKLKTYNLRAYSPPKGLALHDVHNSWELLANGEADHKKKLTKIIRETKDAIRKDFANAANMFQDSLNDLSANLAALSGDLEHQLRTTKQLATQIQPLSAEIDTLVKLDNVCLEANIEDNEFTIYSVEDLIFGLSLLKDSVSKKISFVENQIIARTKTNFTPEQLEQYSETFRLFDKDQSNTLKRDEFKAALAAEGTDFSEEAFEKTFLQVSQGTDQITFEQVIVLM